MAKKRAKKRVSMRPAAPELLIRPPADAVEVVEASVARPLDLADTLALPRPAALDALEARPAAPRAPDTLAPVAADAAPADPPSEPALHEDVMDIAFFASGGAVEANLREEARRLAELERDDRPPPPSPRQIARRRSLQRGVGAVVAAVALMFTAAVGLSAARGRGELAAAPAALPAAVEPVALPEPARVPVPAEPAPPASVAPAAAAQPAAPVAAPDPAAAKALTRQALSALERGKYADAVAHAKASVEADPSDANAYLYWGTALLETGKRAEAKAVFSACVEAATRGPKHECRAFR
ncbi:MAG: tetratricopeptide repeat protein [Polyangiaceae bacterium]|nr:tetratricopeptide repeat protein [Polyangiaceae bacterium]